MKRTGSQPEGAAVGSSITDDRTSVAVGGMSVPVGGSGEGDTDVAVGSAVDVYGSGDGRTGVAVSGMDVEVAGSGVGDGNIVSDLTLSVARVPAVFAVGITVGKAVCDGSAATIGGGAFKLLVIRRTAMITTTITVPKTSSGK